MKMTRRSFLSASAFTLLACGLAPAAHAEETNSLLTGLLGGKAETALPPKPLPHPGPGGRGRPGMG